MAVASIPSKYQFSLSCERGVMKGWELLKDMGVRAMCFLVLDLKRSPARQLQLAALEIVTWPRLKLLAQGADSM